MTASGSVRRSTRADAPRMEVCGDRLAVVYYLHPGEGPSPQPLRPWVAMPSMK